MELVPESRESSKGGGKRGGAGKRERNRKGAGRNARRERRQKVVGSRGRRIFIGRGVCGGGAGSRHGKKEGR